MSTQVAAPQEPFVAISPDAIDALVRSAQRAPLHRARLCLHEDANDPIHEMIIAFCQDSYVAPHRHPGKTESFHVIAGTIDVILFDDHGTVRSKIRLAGNDPTLPQLYRLREPLWHTVVIQSEHAVLHEITNGPYDPGRTEFAPWAPAPNDPDAIVRIRRAATDPIS